MDRGISVIVVNYRTGRYLPDLLRSMGKVSEVIIFDNSPFEVLRLVEKGKVSLPPRFVLISSATNVGFAKAVNIALEFARCDLVLFANPDLRFEDGAVEMLASFLRDNPDYDSVAPLLFREDGTVDSSGMVFYRDRVPVDSKEAKGGDRVGLSLACAMWKKTSVDRHKVCGEFLDSSYFAYLEDFDLYWRSYLFGGRHRVLEDAIAYHVRGGSGGRRKWWLKFVAEKNRALTVLKNDSLKGVFLDIHEFLLHEAANFFKKLIRPYLFLSWTLLWWNFAKSLRWRKEVEEKRKVSRESVRRVMRRWRLFEKFFERFFRVSGKGL